jgi:hypothetical protein
MQIDPNSIDLEMFMKHEHIIDGHKCWLIQPQHIGCKWTKENAIFRSSLWDEFGNPVSLSFKKFVNWGEKPEVFPLPTDLSTCELIEKEDGSTLIVSWPSWSDNLNLRTRGTSDARKLDNGHEIDIILGKYPQIRDVFTSMEEQSLSGEQYTLLFEWVSSENVIVLKYAETPDIILTGIIRHSDYSYLSQEALDNCAASFGFKRPKRHKFDSFEKLLSTVPGMSGIEGLCIYHEGGQEIHKLKTETYLAIHRFKSKANIETVTDLFFELKCPSYEAFEKYLIEQFDHECFVLVEAYAKLVCSTYQQALIIIDALKSFVDELKNLSRKEAALQIIAKYSEQNLTGYAFNLLGGKPLDDKSIKKLVQQLLVSS